MNNKNESKVCKDFAFKYVYKNDFFIYERIFLMSERSRKTFIRVMAIVLAALMVGGSATAVISMLFA